MPENKEMDFGPDILSLVDEDGVEHEFEVVDTLDKDDNTYLALIPVVDENNIGDADGELVILKVLEEDGEEFLIAIEDDDEFDDVSDIFMDRLEDMYEFEEEN
ncbi:MAG: DUF1292 domain-containing protein [Oscillospiraceae bacterium]|nr:DUF1292 domain-containing protein [Oscillospiraceae bacterium]